MAARRCSIGCESWPDEPIFGHCTVCGEPTVRFRNIEPTVERDEARRMMLHHLFEQYYERRCMKLGIPVDGPLA